MLMVFNESIDLGIGHDRWVAHSIVDELYHMAIANDGEQDFVVEPEYMDLDSLSFNNDLTIHDFDLIDVTVEELEEEREELHSLISKRDSEGLVGFYSSLPIEFKQEDRVSIKELLESGRLEELVADHIAENHGGYYIEHSKSCVKSNSFYIKNENGDTVLKLSDHNTIFQEVKYSTPFINVLGEHGIEPSLENILERIDKVLK